MTNPPPQPITIWRLQRALYPSFALLAGIQLDLFTPLTDGPMTAEQVAVGLGVGTDKLRALLYILADAELLTVKGDLFSNTAEADRFLVRGKPSYIGAGY